MKLHSLIKRSNSKSTNKFKPRKRAPGEATPINRELFMRGSYDPVELRPFTERAGAMDAFTKPSIGDPT